MFRLEPDPPQRKLLYRRRPVRPPLSPPPWRSFEAVEFATLEWIDCLNHRRLLEPIGNIPLAETEARYYAMLEQPAMAA